MNHIAQNILSLHQNLIQLPSSLPLTFILAYNGMKSAFIGLSTFIATPNPSILYKAGEGI